VVADPAALFTQTLHFDNVLWRNIKGVRVSQNLFDDLSDDPEEQTYGISAESLSKPSGETVLLSRPFDYARAVFFPFEQASWQETRYGDGTHYGVWYGSESTETTVYESTYHWVRFLRDAPTREPGEEIVGERRVFTADCQGLLADLRGKHRIEPRLVHPGDYGFTQRVGWYAWEQGLNGMLAPSARHPNGVNGAILNRRILSNPRDRCYLTYRWNVGSDEVQVERRRGVIWFRVAVPE